MLGELSYRKKGKDAFYAVWFADKRRENKKRFKKRYVLGHFKKMFFLSFYQKKKMPITNVELDYIFRNRKRFLEHYLNYIFTFKKNFIMFIMLAW